MCKVAIGQVFCVLRVALLNSTERLRFLGAAYLHVV